jgi:hypothetical protein
MGHTALATRNRAFIVMGIHHGRNEEMGPRRDKEKSQTVM